MRMTDLLACPPALHNRIRAEHSVIRDITRLPARSWVNGIKSAVQAGSPEDH